MRQGWAIALFLSTSFLALPGRAGFLCETHSSCGKDPVYNAAVLACDSKKKVEKCDEWFKVHPAQNEKKLNCDNWVSCPAATQISEQVLTCLQGIGDSEIDQAKSLLQFVVGQNSMPKEIADRETFLRACKSPKCKYKLLGPYKDLFAKEAIEGHPQDTTLDPKLAENGNYLFGYSAEELYRRVIVHLQAQAKAGDFNTNFIEPWTGRPVVLPKTFSQLVDEKMAAAGVKRPGCYDPALVTQMRCYAVFSVLDPYLAAYSLKKIATIAGLGESEGQIIAKTVPVQSGPEPIPNLTRADYNRLNEQAFGIENENLFFYERGSSRKTAQQNQNVIEQMNAWPQTNMNSSRKTGLTAQEIDHLYDRVQYNEVAGLCSMGKYDPKKNGICFGRAMAAHLEALKSGLDKSQIRKVWAVGELDSVNGHWHYHVATVVRDTAGRWWAIDQILNKPVLLEDWYAKMKSFDVQGNVKLFSTKAEKFFPTSSASPRTIQRNAKSEDMEAQSSRYLNRYFDGFFKDLMTTFKGDPRNEP